MSTATATGSRITWTETKTYDGIGANGDPLVITRTRSMVLIEDAGELELAGRRHLIVAGREGNQPGMITSGLIPVADLVA